MRIFVRLFSAAFLVTCCLSLFTHTTRAAGEFETDYKVHYQIDKTGNTSVVENITLKNETPNFYADQFELKIGSTKITDARARDETGDLETNVNFKDNVTTITTKFKQRVIGEGKSLSWTLTYNTTEIATKSGQIWEISIPKLAKTSDTGLYDVLVSVPKSFGPVAFAIPTPVSTTQTAQAQDFIFNRDQLLTSGISMSLGEKQVFAFNLKYLLVNNNLTTQTLDVTLPPDNNYQKIVLESITPTPEDVTIDDDGNFLAKYKLKPKQKVDINVKGEVEVFSKPFRKIEQSLTSAQKETYIQPQRYWETDNSFIKDKAQELKTPDKIYEFVTSYLSYNNDRLKDQKIERKGAAAAYNSPKDAVCMEFTDLYIAIARAAKIPAREVEGYAYTQNERLRPLSLNIYQGDVLHAWPEYWDDLRGWVQVDPTWGSTSGGLDYFSKLDFNHITFIQRGSESTLPIPAGAFKEEQNRNEKTVFVEFADQLPTPVANAHLDLITPPKSYSSIPFKITAVLANTGSTSIMNQLLDFTAQGLENPKASSVNIPILPPFSKKSYDFTFQTKGFFKTTNASVILSFAGSQILKNIKVDPLYKIAIDPMFLASITTATVIVIIGLFLYRKATRHKNHHPFGS